jgi:hypothetical protein
VQLDELWSDDQQALIMPALSDLARDGEVDRADDWETLKTEVVSRLDHYGAGSGDKEELVRPLDAAVDGGANIKDLVGELVTEYDTELEQRQLATAVETAPPVQESEPGEREAAAFAAELPPAEELADRIVMDLGPHIAALIAANPDLAGVGDEELTVWISEDVGTTINEIAEIGWGLGE